MSKWTPGPWLTHVPDESGWIDICRMEEDGLSLPFAACKHFDQEANARLIAAAPDLLSALEHIANSCEGRAVEVARAAIAKATGSAA